jgi:uncharacterized protein (TIRG00374 family)
VAESERITTHQDAVPGDDDAVTAPEAIPAQLNLGKRLLSWRTLVPLVIVVVILALAVKSFVTGFRPAAIASAIAHANLAFYLLGGALYYVSFAIRVVRWRMMLVNAGIGRAGTARLPGFARLFEILYLAWFANTVVPAKLGDLYRAYLLKQEANISATRSFGTILAERLLDFIILSLLFVGAALVNLGTILAALDAKIRATLQVGLIVLFALILAGLVALIALRAFRDAMRTRIPERFRARYDDFQIGTLGAFKRLPMLLGLTVLVWCCETGRFFFIAKSIDILPSLAPQAFFAAMFIALGESLLTAVPFTSGGIGFVEAGMLAMLLVFVHGPDTQNQAAAAIVLDRSITLVSILLFGSLLYLLVFVRQMRAVRHARR